MYEQYWRLERPAFDNDFRPEFFFPARSHQGALLKLRYLVEHRKGLGVLVGDHGLGKTYLTHVLERECQDSSVQFVRIVFPLLTPSELLRYIGLQLGAVSPGDGIDISADLVLNRLEQFLRQAAESGQRTVVIVDDAHLLNGEHLQVLQLLLNLGGGIAALNLLLVGRSDLLPRLDRLPPLSDRVSVRATLKPLSNDEAEGYVSHRLAAAGVSTGILQPTAIRTAWELSRGVPRLFNQICDLSLLVGFADGLKFLSRIEVQAAAEELGNVSAD
ncbi:MAG: AAA family ATPase [Planctomycetaceae bacterium]|nr:AAA family ATPase [Planctomycetaceae bacterium]